MASGARYRFADLTLDTGQRLLVRGDEPVELSKLTYSLLVALVEAAPKVVTHDELVARVWSGRLTSPETVTQRIKLLRHALGDDATNPRYVGLVRGQGYRLLPAVQPIREVASPEVAAEPLSGTGTASAPGRSLLPRAALPFAALFVIAAGLIVAQSHLRNASMAVSGAGAPAASTPSESPSVAVLPFVNDSPDADQQYFATAFRASSLTR